MVGSNPNDSSYETHTYETRLIIELEKCRTELRGLTLWSNHKGRDVYRFLIFVWLFLFFLSDRALSPFVSFRFISLPFIFLSCSFHFPFIFLSFSFHAFHVLSFSFNVLSFPFIFLSCLSFSFHVLSCPFIFLSFSFHFPIMPFIFLSCHFLLFSFHVHFLLFSFHVHFMSFIFPLISFNFPFIFR